MKSSITNGRCARYKLTKSKCLCFNKYAGKNAERVLNAAESLNGNGGSKNGGEKSLGKKILWSFIP